MKPAAYTQLDQTFTRLYRLRHLGAMAGWDQAAMMPPKGNGARAAALAELQGLIHQTLTDGALRDWLDAARDQAADGREAASVREMRREWEHANLLPAALVQAKSLAGSRCEHAWRTQRPQNDWKGFLENFREVVKLAREYQGVNQNLLDRDLGAPLC